MRYHINFKTTLGTMIIVMLMLFPATQNAYSIANNVNLSNLDVSSDGTSIRITLDGNVETRTFHLENPARWVLDITPSVWSKNVDGKLFPNNKKYFGQVRTGQWQARTARLVIHTKGMHPELEVNDDEILILFEDINGDVVANEALPALSPPEQMKTESTKGLFVIPVEDNKTNVVSIPKVESENIPATTSDNKSIQASGSVKRTGFEIASDGNTTNISIPLVGDMSYEVRRNKYPDRLTVEYPSRKSMEGNLKIKYSTLGKEHMPVGIVKDCLRFESRNIEGYNRLIFYTNSKYQYKTSIAHGTLSIDVRPRENSPNQVMVEPLKIATVESVEIVESEEGFSNQVNLLDAEVLDTTTVSTKSTDEKNENLISGFEINTQTFAPPERKEKRKSFLIDIPRKTDSSEIIDETGHTTPDVSMHTRINDVETIGDLRQASVREMTEFLPEFANSNLLEGSKSLKSGDEKDGFLIAGGPMMFEPPMESKVMPKGTRPAADLFLTKGESVILPVSSLMRASVGDPEVLVVNILSQEELLITAKAKGRTSLILWEDGIGRSVRWVNVGNSTLLQTLDVDRVINDPKIKVSFVGEKTIVLEGSVQTEEQMKRAVKIAAGAVESVDNVVNLIEMKNPKQVLVKVRFVEIQTKNKDEFLKQFGSGTRTEAGNFQFNILTDIVDPEFGSGGIFDISMHPGLVKGDLGDQRFDPIDMMLSYLEQSRCGRILSQPNLVTLSGHPAEFRVGGEIPYTYKNENGFNVVDFREFGVELKITPNVDSDNNINLYLEPSVRVPDFTLAIAGIPGFKTRLVKTYIQVADSQTIVIGGLIQDEKTTIKSKVPILGDIPLLGELFRSKKTTEDELELLIFLTPVVLKNVSDVEGHINSDADVSLSPYYQREVIEAREEED